MGNNYYNDDDWKNTHPGEEHVYQPDLNAKINPNKLRIRKVSNIIWPAITLTLLLVIVILLWHPFNPTTASTPKPAAAAPTQTQQQTQGAQTSATPTPAITPTSVASVASVAPGTVLCQYNQTKGFNNWTGAPQWKQINNGMYVSDGTSDGSTNGFISWSDCKPATANYAVEAKIQFIRTSNSVGTFEFGIMLHGDGNQNGYEVGAGIGISNNSCSQAEVKQAFVSLIAGDKESNDCYNNNVELNPLSGNTSANSYAVDTNLHTYRAEISGNTIKLSIDGQLLITTQDNTYSDAGQVGLRDVYGELNVESFTVTAL